MKKYYVKCYNNEQAQSIRNFLVDAGFKDNNWWNNKSISKEHNYILFYEDSSFDIINHLPITKHEPLFYIINKDVDLLETSKIIKELFDYKISFGIIEKFNEKIAIYMGATIHENQNIKVAKFLTYTVYLSMIPYDRDWTTLIPVWHKIKYDLEKNSKEDAKLLCTKIRTALTEQLVPFTAFKLISEAIDLLNEDK